MKNQYFGDENDYRKYGLLRALTGCGELSLCVCWMLTTDDGSSDGRFTGYLHAGHSWRRYDPELFEALHNAVIVAGRRAVDVCNERRLLPGARFHDAVLSDRVTERDHYFHALESTANGADLVFFDPDNGFEISSCRRGARGSSKYLFWSEFEATFARGHSVLVYQHYPRLPRDEFTRQITQRIAERVGAESVHTFATSRVLFLLVPQARHALSLRERAHSVA